MLVDRNWTSEWQPVQATDEKGRVRPSDLEVPQLGHAGRKCWTDRRGGFAAEAGRYHLYVALICPGPSSTLIGRKLKKLDDVISVSVVEPSLTDQGWRFGDYPASDHDDLNGATFLHEIYTRAAPTFTGWATVPVLWDKRRGTIVSNESPDILRMLDSGFGGWPTSRSTSIGQPARHVFPMLDELDQRLAWTRLSLRRGSDRGRYPTVRDLGAVLILPTTVSSKQTCGGSPTLRVSARLARR